MLYHAITLVDVAYPMSQLHVLGFMGPAFTQRDDVVDAHRQWMRICKTHINLFATYLTTTFIPQVDLLTAHWCNICVYLPGSVAATFFTLCLRGIVTLARLPSGLVQQSVMLFATCLLVS